MLRDAPAVTISCTSPARPGCQTLLPAEPGDVRVSAGTAAVIGLQPLKQADPPSTAYLMIGERCRYDCAFCAQAHRSNAQSGFLSRVVWPSFSWTDTLAAVSTGYERGLVKRCCFQVTVSNGYLQRTQDLVRDLVREAVELAPNLPRVLIAQARVLPRFHRRQAVVGTRIRLQFRQPRVQRDRAGPRRGPAGHIGGPGRL